MRANAPVPVRTATELHRIMTWVGGSCGAAAAAAGYFVGFIYSLEEGFPAHAWGFGAIGQVVGACLGLLNATGPVVVLAAINGRLWASATPLRALLAAVAAEAPISVLTLTTEPSVRLMALGLWAIPTAVPAAIATVLLDWRTTSAARNARERIAVAG